MNLGAILRATGDHRTDGATVIRIEQPRHLKLSVGWTRRDTLAVGKSVSLAVLLLSALKFGQLCLETQLGRVVSPGRWIAAACSPAISVVMPILLVIAAVRIGVCHIERPFAEIRGHRLRLGPGRLSIRLEHLISCKIEADIRMPGAYRVALRVFSPRHNRPISWILWVEDLDQAVAFRRGLLELTE